MKTFYIRVPYNFYSIRIFIFQCNESPPKITLLQKRFIYYKSDVIPADVLENLLCLSEEDKEDILCCANNKSEGNTKALEKLVKLLAHNDKGFDQFVVALRKANLDHVVSLLDPYENGELLFVNFFKLFPQAFKVVCIA